MIDDRDVFERSVQRFAPPVDAFERMMTRRDRKQRNKRLAAGVLVLILAFVVIGAVLRSIATSPSVPTTPNPSPSASNGNVTFVGTDLVDFSDRHSDFGIVFGVDPTDGKTRTILDTNCPSHPALEAACGHLDLASLDWSPDGSRLAFTLFADQAYRGFEGIWVMEMETDEIRQLTSCTDPCAKQVDLDWSPDGSRIAYSQADVEYCTSGTYDVGSCSLYTMNADG